MLFCSIYKMAVQFRRSFIKIMLSLQNSSARYLEINVCFHDTACTSGQYIQGNISD